MRLLQKIGLFRVAPRDNVAIFSAWLYRLSHNRMIDLLRKERRTPTVSLEQMPGVVDRTPLLQIVEERIDFEVIADKLRLLNDPQRLVLGNDLGTKFATMDLAAVPIYDRALTPAEHAQVVAYLDDAYLA